MFHLGGSLVFEALVREVFSVDLVAVIWIFLEPLYVCQSFRLNGQSTFIEPAAFLHRCSKARMMPGDGLMSDPRVEGPVSQGNDALRRFNASGAMLVGLVTVNAIPYTLGFFNDLY